MIFVHRIKRKSFVLIILLINLSYNFSTAQHVMRGSITDQKSGEPLAFVNVIVNGDPLKGTTSDVQGQFEYQSQEAIRYLVFSYVGYERDTVRLRDMLDTLNLNIQLFPASYAFEEVVVQAGENPANRIIRNVIRNKKRNNPEEVASFTCRTYNKVIYDFVYPAQNRDSLIGDPFNNFFQGGHVLMMESVTKKKYVQPDRSEEVILGVKVSGFREASFAPLATDIQPFSFYREVIPIFDVNYINPISDGSLSRYYFSLEDTVYQHQDTTFILSYKPLPNKNFEGLQGLLYINTSTYAIQYVIASPAKKGLIDIKIQQQYAFVDGKQWFPGELNFEFIMYPSGMEDIGLSANGVSYIDSVTLLPDLSRKDFGYDAVWMTDKANQRDSVFWRNHRRTPLDKEELTTYRVLDSLGQQYKFDAVLSTIDKLARDRIGISIFDIDISRTLLFNKFEGFRLGLGLYTNEKLFKHVSLGGYFGYGLKDHQWKYGGEVIWTIHEYNELILKGGYQNTLVEAGSHQLRLFDRRKYDFRSWLAYRMDRVEQYALGLESRAFRYANMNVSFRRNEIAPQYGYQYKVPGQEGFTTYHTTELALGIRYAFREKLIRSMGQPIRRERMGTDYPVVTFVYTRGLKDVLIGQLDYHKYEARIEQSFYHKALGKTKIRVDAGWAVGTLPYGLLFTGEGSYTQPFSIEIKNYFQTVDLYEFLSDQYVSVFFSHNFGSLLFHAGKFKPHMTIVQNIGWGRLAHPEYHRFVSFKTKEKGLYETGIQVDNLLKINYLNVAYLGLGLGAYCRYGPYASDSFSRNMAYKFSMTFTTN